MKPDPSPPVVRDSVYESRRSILGPRTPQGPRAAARGKSKTQRKRTTARQK